MVLPLKISGLNTQISFPIATLKLSRKIKLDKFVLKYIQVLRI